MSDLKQDLLGDQDVEQVIICAQNLNYTVNDNLSVLKNINLQFQPNEIVALMGPSGAGKTSLLSVLAARAAGKVDGSVLANNRPINQNFLKRFANYIPQEDILIASLSPRETLMFTAELRLPDSVSSSAKLQRVNQLLADFSLTECADTPIGDGQIRGISGGQRKRVSVAQELVTNPSVLFVDECTSGLDSKTADDVIRLLAAIAHKGRTVICSIHQPSKRIFYLFDRFLLLLAGETVFFGSPADSVSYFTSLGFPLPEHENPPNFYMETLQVTLEDTSFAREWEKRKDAFSLPWSNVEALDDGDNVDPSYPTSFLSQVKTLTQRGVYLTVRDPRMFTTRILSTALATVICTSFFPAVDDDQLSGHDVLSAILITQVYIGMDGTIQQAIVFPLEKMVVVREYNNGSYYILSYFASKWLVSFVFQTLYGMIFSAVFYPIVHLRFGFDHFLIFLYNIMMIGGFSVGLGFAIGAVSISVMMANLLITPNYMALLFVGGFLIPRDEIPPWYIWLYYLNPLMWCTKAMFINQLKGNDFSPCASQKPGDCPYGEGVAEGEVLLDQYQIDESDMGLSLFLLTMFTFGVAHMAYMLLVWIVQRTKF